MSSSAPAPGSDAPAGPPRWLLVMLAAGLSLVVAAVLVLLLDVAGVERISRLAFFLVIAVSAVVGGTVVRLLAPRLSPVRRPPRS